MTSNKNILKQVNSTNGKHLNFKKYEKTMKPYLTLGKHIKFSINKNYSKNVIKKC